MQGSPSNQRQAGSASYMALQSYSEHAYLLWLLALCRLMGSSFVDVAAIKEGNKGTSTTSYNVLWWLDLILGPLSVLLFLTMCLTMGWTVSSIDSLSFIVAEQQGAMHWVLFLTLNVIYLLHVPPPHPPPSSQGGSADSKVASMLWVLGKTLVLVGGCLSFHLSLGGDVSASRQQHLLGSTFDFYILRKWSSMDVFGRASSNGYMTGVDILRTFLQLWMGLHVGRWFICISAVLLDRLR